MRPKSILLFPAIALFLFLPYLGAGDASAQAVNGEIVGDEPLPVLVEPEPADGKWLRDSEGREYMELRTPVAHAQKVSGTEIVTIFGLKLDLLRMEGNEFVYKYYRPLPRTTPPKKDLAAEGELIDKFYRSAFEDSSLVVAKPFDKGLPKSGQWREGFDIADMNEDGQLDLVFGPPRKSTGGPVIFLGNGKGEWAAWKEATYPPLAYDYGTAAVADFNGDGHLDIVYGVHLRGLLAVHGDGKGNFVAAGKGLEFAVPGRDANEAFSSKAIAIADWNGDRRPDILALGEGPRLNLTGEKKGLSGSFGIVAYLNDGAGNWTRSGTSDAAKSNLGDSIVVRDLDRDGALDLLSASMALGRRDIVHFGGVKSATGPATEIKELRPNLLVRSVAAGDVDGNGLDDVVVAYTAFEAESWRSAADLLLQFPNRRWSRQVLMSTKGTGGPTSVAIGDVTGDNRPDVFVGTEEGEIWPFASDAENGFTRDRMIAGSAGDCKAGALAMRDLDGDRRPELIALFADENDEDKKGCPSEGAIGVWTFSDTRRR